MNSGRFARNVFWYVGAVLIGSFLIGTGGCATSGPGLDVEAATGLTSDEVAARLKEADEAAARMQSEEAAPSSASRDSGSGSAQPSRGTEDARSAPPAPSPPSPPEPQPVPSEPDFLEDTENQWDTAGLDDGSGQQVTWGTVLWKDDSASGAVWQDGGAGPSFTNRSLTDSAVAFPSGEGGSWGASTGSMPVAAAETLTQNEFVTDWNDVELHVGKLGRVTYLYRPDHRMGMVANAPDKAYERLGIKSGDWYILCSAGEAECRMRVSYRPEGTQNFETALLFLYASKGEKRHIVCVGEGDPKTAPVKISVDRKRDYMEAGAACFAPGESGRLMKELDRGRVVVFEAATRGGRAPGWLSTYGFIEAVELMEWMYGQLIES